MDSFEENPIDKDKTTETPGILAYPHTIGSAIIKPEDLGKIKGRAVTAMRQQTKRQMDQLYGQMKVLAEQAQQLKRRVEVSERIYQAQLNYEPVIGHDYFLYQKDDDTDVLSLIAPHEWRRVFPFKKFIAEVTLLADHTWEVKNSDDIE